MLCRHCGEYIDTRYREKDGSVVCPGCGVVYKPKKKVEQNHKGRRKRRRRRQIWPKVLLVLLLLAILCLGGYFTYQHFAQLTTTEPNHTPTPAPAVIYDELDSEMPDDADDPLISQSLTVYESDPASFVTDTETGIRFVNNELLLIASTEVQRSDVENAISAHGGTIVGYNAYLNQYQIQFQTSYSSLPALQQIRNDLEASGLFSNSYPNYVIPVGECAFYPDDAEWSNWGSTAEKHWGADAIRLPEMWELFRSNVHQPINVGIMDSQFYTAHEDLSFSGTYLNNFQYKSGNHGTHVAGIIGAKQNNTKGISGVAPDVNLFGFSIVGHERLSEDQKLNVEGVSVADTQAGLTYLICIKECKVINYSWGIQPSVVYSDYGFTEEQYNAGAFDKYLGERWLQYSEPVIHALKQFLAEGFDFLIVSAAGNNNDTYGSMGNATYTNELACITDPVLYSRIIVVGSARQDSNGNFGVSDFSNYGSRVDVIAPGENILSTVCDLEAFGRKISSYNYDGGTSMAAPQVSGVAAAIWSLNSSLTAPEVKQIICDTASGTYSYRFDQRFTRSDVYSMLDAYAAAEAAVSFSHQSPDPVPINADWRSAYLAELETNSANIRAYTWQNGYPGTQPVIPESHQIAICDVTDDGVPELIYIRDAAYTGTPGGVSSMLSIFTPTADGSVMKLFELEGVDVLAGGGSSYCFFQIDGSSELYGYHRYGDSYIMQSLFKLQMSGNGTLERVAVAESRGDFQTGITDYWNSGGTITAEEYDSILYQTVSHANNMLFFGHLREPDVPLTDLANRIGTSAMTYDEAIAFLGGDSIELPDADRYLGTWYAQASWTFDPSCKDVLNIVNIEKDRIDFGITFYRVWGPDKVLTAYLSSDMVAYFVDETSHFSGKLEFIEEGIVLTIDDVTNFLGGNSSSVEYLGGATHLFKQGG